LLLYSGIAVVLTCTFWALFALPGYALGRGCLPGLARFGRLLAPPAGSGLLAGLAYAYLASFSLLAPVSLACYALGAPLAVFSAALCALVALALYGLARAATHGAARSWPAALRAEPWVPWAVIAGLLWLQSRVGGWLDGDATFHLGRIRVLLEHGFSNRDIYLREYHFQHAYHSNLLFPVYASLAQLTRQSYLQTWVHSEAWAKLLVAAGHYVLGFTLTRKKIAGFLLATCIITLNAGETYSVYPNTLCVGFLVPIVLALGFACVTNAPDVSRRELLPLAAAAFVLAQVHALYVVYAVLTVGPVLVLGWLRPQPPSTRRLCLAALLSFGLAAPFLLVSMFGPRAEAALSSAPDDVEPPAVQKGPPPGIASAAPARISVPEALVAGGGHLEKVLDSPEDGVMLFKPERMGGLASVLAGFVALCLAPLLYPLRRLPLLAALAGACWLGAALFTRTGATLAWHALSAPFIVARLSTLLTSLLVFGVCACLAWPIERLARGRALAAALACLLLTYASTRALGHAPLSFQQHVQAALAPTEERMALLTRLMERRAMLRQNIPAGSTVLTTARFARQLVMLCDCYVLAADRGHTQLAGIDKRRRDLVFLNAALSPWDQRAKLIAHYGVQLVTFENRWHRRYQWAYDHGELIGSAGGQDVVALRLP
jgi:hypothetical protein